MFTGLIEEIGIIQIIERISGGLKLTISADIILSDLQIDHSMAVNGVCLTVTSFGKEYFKVEAVGTTLQKSTLGKIKIGNKVNLERSLKLSSRLGGHLVQGHVNTIGKVKEIQKLGENYFLLINIPPEIRKYVIEEGSIAIDGISLTISEINGSNIGLSIIPHTYKKTIISEYKTNQQVNIETDFLAKYVENFIDNNKSKKKSEITINKLKNAGY